MNKPDRADVRRVRVRFARITVESLHLRRHVDDSRGFDILIDDPHIGRFALTPAVPDLELREEDSYWRQVTLDELKKILAKDDELVEAAEKPQASAERPSFNRLVAEGEHIMNADCPRSRHNPEKLGSSFEHLGMGGISLRPCQGCPSCGHMTPSRCALFGSARPPGGSRNFSAFTIRGSTLGNPCDSRNQRSYWPSRVLISDSACFL
jgi:hypothetical protein